MRVVTVTKWVNLHSNMYLLIPGIEPATQGKNEDLHSNMYLLIHYWRM